MQKQMTFSDVEYGARKRTSRREIFLDMMDGALEETIYDSYAMGKFMKLNFLGRFKTW
jgi:hypothetical protein